ncbi:hypothetical protein CBR_g1151 [Chara braunii]|uniref:Uncharacterized protein n=1 Tax=Chara braunii TaxID=69332 RepID=A0A388KDC3_CHABU|nr:hypothetical protein CBR_g1151 [Chara braunii]|eukprot:GBG68031.1 hypothetical protein CBR_g1151 [Chara braunii]
MSFATERAFGDQLLMPRGEISAIRQVHHPRISPDFLRLAQFFCTSGVYGAAEFQFTSDPQVVVLAEAMAFQRRATPGISHVSTVVVFSGDITTFDPVRQAAIKSTLYKWGQFVELLFCLLRVDLNWTWEGDQRPASETVELLVIQAWTTNVAGDLLGFVFGAVDRGYRSQIVRELTIVIARLADELPLDIVSQSDEEAVPHVLSRTLAPSLQWSACIEERWADDRFPSRSEYLDVQSLTNPRFFRQPTAFEWAALRAEEEAEEKSEGELRREAGGAAARLAEDEEEEREAEEEEAEGETSEEEEEAYSKHSEGEQSEEEEDEDHDEGVISTYVYDCMGSGMNSCYYSSLPSLQTLRTPVPDAADNFCESRSLDIVITPSKRGHPAHRGDGMPRRRARHLGVPSFNINVMRRLRLDDIINDAVGLPSDAGTGPPRGSREPSIRVNSPSVIGADYRYVPMDMLSSPSREGNEGGGGHVARLSDVDLPVGEDTAISA